MFADSPATRGPDYPMPSSAGLRATSLDSPSAPRKSPPDLIDVAMLKSYAEEIRAALKHVATRLRDLDEWECGVSIVDANGNQINLLDAQVSVEMVSRRLF